MLRNWWSADVVSILLALHLLYTAQFAVGEQSLDWLEGKSADAKTKFERIKRIVKMSLS
jgi:hypothetical protein